MSNAKNKPWFRFYHEALDDPKVQRLPHDVFRAWINILCLACRNDGDLPSRDDIAFALRMSDHDASHAIDRLIDAQLIDIGPDGKLQPHNWAGRQFQSDADPTATERKRRQRERSKVTRDTSQDVTRDTTVTVTRTDTESDTDTETEKDQTRERARGGGDLDECKVAFNGSTESMIAEVQSAMGGGQADRRCAEQWLANLLRTHGQQAVQGGFQALLTAKNTGGVMPRPLNYWSGAAAKIATKPQEPQAKKRLTAAEYMAEQRKIEEAAR